jgi:hypothetical protein
LPIFAIVNFHVFPDHLCRKLEAYPTTSSAVLQRPTPSADFSGCRSGDGPTCRARPGAARQAAPTGKTPLGRLSCTIQFECSTLALRTVQSVTCGTFRSDRGPSGRAHRLGKGDAMNTLDWVSLVSACLILAYAADIVRLAARYDRANTTEAIEAASACAELRETLCQRVQNVQPAATSQVRPSVRSSTTVWSGATNSGEFEPRGTAPDDARPRSPTWLAALTRQQLRDWLAELGEEDAVVHVVLRPGIRDSAVGPPGGPQLSPDCSALPNQKIVLPSTNGNLGNAELCCSPRHVESTLCGGVGGDTAKRVFSWTVS